MRIISVDIETFSSFDLPSCGVYRYVEAPDFDILLITYCLDGEFITIDTTEPGAKNSSQFQRFVELVTDPTCIKSAFNANFERTCLAKWLGVPMPPEQWRCTMVKALSLGLPGSLATVGKALGLAEDKLKDSRGKALIDYFSKPCKPTKANHGRTRNMPGDDRDKWELYKAYNRQDVVTEQEIYKLLSIYKTTESEQHLWELDQQMNDRGILLDVELAKNVVDFDEIRKEELTVESKELTGLENPNSVAQLKDWLSSKGINVSGVTKDTVGEILAKNDIPADVRRVLEIRRALGKSSITKYSAMLNAVCEDHRLRGILQFYGANRTGRWAGRIVQVHNLAKNYLEDIGLARELTAEGDFDTLTTLFGESAFVFSELVRTAFIASPGNRFVVSDFSAIEARVLAWLAGEEWVLEAFRNGKDIYCETASMMFHVPVVKHGQNGHLRQKGKVAVLACIAEGSLVLTDCGLVPIENVTTDMKVWDGLEWVSHDGVVYNGVREVISYGGLEATEDHTVWAEVNGSYREVRFGECASMRQNIVKSGDGRKTIWLGENHFSGEKISERMDETICPDTMCRVRKNTMDDSFKSDEGKIKGMSVVFSAKNRTILARPEANSCEAEVRESEGSKLCEVRGKRDQIRISKCNGRLPVSNRKFWRTRQIYGNRQNRQQRELFTGELAIRNEIGKHRKPEYNGSQQIRSEVLAVFGNGGSKKTCAGFDQGRNNNGRQESSRSETAKLEGHKRKARVYDIRNAGKHNRFTVSNCLVHNCGYGGGVGAMKRMDASGSIPEDELQSTVTQWRQANPKIVKLWYACEKAAKTAISEHRTVKLERGLAFSYINGNLFVTLPSGRKLCYWNTRLKDDPVNQGKQKIVYMGVNQETKKWGETDTWGGKLVENLIQGIARDCLAVSMERVSALGYQIVMHVHDEMIVDVPEEDTTALDTINACMGEEIPWAKGLPLKGDGYETKYYVKD